MAEFDSTGMREIKITDPDHVFHNGVLAGLQLAERLVAEASEKHRIAGLGMAAAVVSTARADQQTSVMLRNIRHAAKSGVNLATESVAAVRGDTLYIRELDLVEQAEG